MQLDESRRKESTYHVAPGSAAIGKRLDVYLQERLHEYSRTLLQRFIRDGDIRRNGEVVRPSTPIAADDVIDLSLPRLILPQMIPEEMPLDILYEDEDLIAVNKPPHLVVHPAAGHWSGTLVNGLLHHCGVLPETDDIYRPGVVHRLDKNTSGVILSAKTNRAHQGLGRQFRARTVKKTYLAIVEGFITRAGDAIDKPIGPHPRNREKMAVIKEGGKEAFTTFEVIERFRKFSLVIAKPRTGRTHQIRVHLAWVGHPVVADPFYGYREVLFPSDVGAEEELVAEGEGLRRVPLLSRHALHAHRIEFQHPVSGETLRITAPPTADIEGVLQVLRRTMPV